MSDPVDLKALREAVDESGTFAVAFKHHAIYLDAARSLLEADRQWLCIDRGAVNVGISNQPGNPGYCYFTSTPSHLEECGPVIMVRVEE